MKKAFLLVATLFCAMSVYAVFGSGSDIDDGIDDVELSNSGKTVSDDAETAEVDEKASEESESLTEKAKEELEEKTEEEENTGLATLPNGTAYVGVYDYLNLRDGVWGNILGHLFNNEEVTITGRDGDWYKVSTSKGDGYAHARYVFDSKDKRYYGNEVYESDNPNGYSGSSSGSSDIIIDVDGDSLQGKILSAAKQIHDQYQGYQAFPYDPLTEGGNLGCAQVATTVLKAAGALDTTSLSCDQTINLLEAKGWQSVSWPPYQAGDVVFWTTYLPGASHVGIVMNSGNSAQAMNNSSSLRMPTYSDITAMTIYKIYRKS